MSIAAKRSRDRGKKKLTKAVLSVGVTLVLLIVLAVWVLAPKSSGVKISESGFTSVSRVDVVDRVRVEGKIQPHRVESLFSSLTGKVSGIEVAIGDRVSAGQHVVTIDTQTVQRELDSARIQQGGLVANSNSQVATARSQVDQYRKGIENGTNPEISAATNALRQAQEQRNAAQSDLNAKVDARDGVAAAGVADPALDQEVRAAQSALNAAQQSVGDAERAVSAARETAQNQLTAHESALAEAINSANGAQATSDQTLGQLEADLASGRLTAPFAGVVLNIAAQKGAQPTGALLTVGDDSKLVIETSVGEADVAKLSKGNSVTFTTAGSDKERTGVVTFVSPVAKAESEATDAAAAAATQGNPEFKVLIEVTGDREGLLLGSKVRAQIKTDEVKNTLAVPLDAVYTKDNGSKAVLVLKREGDNLAVIEERSVETGIRNNVEIAVTGGDLREGDEVVSQASEYREGIGSDIEITAE